MALKLETDDCCNLLKKPWPSFRNP